VSPEELFLTIPDSDGKDETDADKLCRLLDLNLASERVAWQRARSRRPKIRAVSFVVLLLLIVGALAASFFIFSRATERRTNQNPSAAVPER
jgi:hypothetical protein